MPCDQVTSWRPSSALNLKLTNSQNVARLEFLSIFTGSTSLLHQSRPAFYHTYNPCSQHDICVQQLGTYRGVQNRTKFYFQSRNSRQTDKLYWLPTLSNHCNSICQPVQTRWQATNQPQSDNRRQTSTRIYYIVGAHLFSPAQCVFSVISLPSPLSFSYWITFVLCHLHEPGHIICGVTSVKEAARSVIPPLVLGQAGGQICAGHARGSNFFLIAIPPSFNNICSFYLCWLLRGSMVNNRHHHYS